MTGQILPFPPASPPPSRRRRTSRRPAEARRRRATRRHHAVGACPVRPSGAGSSVTRLRPRPSGAPEHAGPAAVCLMCEGWSEDEVNALLDERICSPGWTTMGVADRPGQPTWMYTIGLAIVGHPELLIATVARAGGRDPRRSRRSGRRRGRAFDTVDEATVSTGSPLPCGTSTRPTSSGASWAPARGTTTGPVARCRPLPARQQVVLPDSEFCRCHADGQPQLHLAPCAVRHRRPQSGRTAPYGPPPSGSQ